MYFLIFQVNSAHSFLSAILWTGITKRACWFDFFSSTGHGWLGPVHQHFWQTGAGTWSVSKLSLTSQKSELGWTPGYWVEVSALLTKLSDFVMQANEGKSDLLFSDFLVKTTSKDKCQIYWSQFWRELFFILGFFPFLYYLV